VPEGPPLFTAISRFCSRDVLTLLVEKGADPAARREGDRRSAYQVALRHGHAEAAAYLEEIGAATEADPFERFAGACGRGDLATARQVLAESPGLLAQLAAEDTAAFLRLAGKGPAKALAAMLDCGVPASLCGVQKETALHWAAWHGRRDAVEVLLAHGAAVAAVEQSFGATPLGWAVHGSGNWPNPEGDYPGVVRLLLAAGADPESASVLPEGDDPAIVSLLREARGRHREFGRE
ncbi:MAG TPA: ankyrin repeat domain-containing protein, partial [Thermoanaerobaculia bacterium]|nr:ankyrin repeat domain-containing protein [Thermoanaerobaculia bacterium]